MRYILILATLVVSTLPAWAGATFHADAGRTGVYPGPGPAELHGVKWTFKTGGPVVTSPVVSDGVVYVASYDGHLYALDRETGEEKWKFKSRMPIASSPCVAGGLVYFVSSTGALAALDVSTGEQKWVLPTEYERKFQAKNLHGYPPAAQTIPDAWDLYTSSPVVVGGRVYFGSGDGGVYAADAATGVLQWKFSTGDVVHASPAVVGGVVYVGSYDSRLYAIDAATGRQKWVFQAGLDPAIHNQEGFQSSPAVVDGTVYVGCRDAHVYAIDAATGRKIWDHPTSKSWVIGTPAVRDGVVYVGTSDSARFMALDAKTGRLLFNVDMKAYVFSSSALAGDRAYVGVFNGRLHAIDTETGAIAWTFETEASKSDPMNVLKDDGGLEPAAFASLFGDFQDMYLVFHKLISVGAIVSSPAVEGDTVLFGSMDGNVYALR